MAGEAGVATGHPGNTVQTRCGTAPGTCMHTFQMPMRCDTVPGTAAYASNTHDVNDIFIINHSHVVSGQRDINHNIQQINEGPDLKQQAAGPDPAAHVQDLPVVPKPKPPPVMPPKVGAVVRPNVFDGVVVPNEAGDAAGAPKPPKPVAGRGACCCTVEHTEDETGGS